ncbi:hypothetical protein L209DRAFT_176625 [Thermothelomyces heterothallicus CBS 203.75]
MDSEMALPWGQRGGGGGEGVGCSVLQTQQSAYGSIWVGVPASLPHRTPELCRISLLFRSAQFRPMPSEAFTQTWFMPSLPPAFSLSLSLSLFLCLALLTSDQMWSG